MKSSQNLPNSEVNCSIKDLQIHDASSTALPTDDSIESTVALLHDT